MTLPWRVQDALRWADEHLAHTSEPALSARLLLEHALGCATAELIAHPERTLTRDDQAAYRRLVERRARHEPVAYLVGRCGFLDIELHVDARALIPRPETELLVEKAIALTRHWPRPRLVDVGTGSGAIAVSLALHRAAARVVAIDRAAGALDLARENARRHGVHERIQFLHGDLLSPFHGQAHVIVANLPYVSVDEYDALPPDIRCYEPREALVAGPAGLDAIRALLDSAGPHLVDGGAILLEIGAGQGQSVAGLARRAFPGARVTVLPDYAHLDRIVCVET
jgi:release factor glutamine methyltransferase